MNATVEVSIWKDEHGELHYGAISDGSILGDKLAAMMDDALEVHCYDLEDLYDADAADSVAQRREDERMDGER